MRLNDISISWKLFSLVGLMMVSILSSYLLSLKYSHQDYLDYQKQTAKTVVESTVSYLKPLLEQAKNEEEKLKIAHDTLQHLRYDNDNYLFIHNIRGFNVVHPIAPELEGTDISQITDPKGTLIIQIMLQGIRDKGEIYWQFLWPKPGSDMPVEKLGYALLIPGTDWIVGTGIYLDDLASSLSQRNMAYTSTIIFSLLLAYFIASKIAYSISAPASRIVDEIGRISRKEFTEQSTDTDRKDEMGQIAQALLDYRKQAEENSLLRLENEQAKLLETYDPATRLLTRKAFEEALTNSLATAQKSAVIITKVPLLRDIQAQWGSAYCNQVLNILTERIRDTLVPGDILARNNDDSFAIIRENSVDINDISDLVIVLQTLIMQPVEIDENRLSFQSRSGISFAPDDGTAALQLISHAEEALSEARRLELDYMFFNQLRTFALDERLELWKDIQTALNEDQFHLVFQPLFDLKTNQIISAEVLLRWEHPTKGFISPAKFVAFAEQSGLVSQLDNWVLKATARQLNEWYERGIDNPPLAINLSGLTFVRCDIKDLIDSVTAIYPIALSKIELELTEGVLVESIETLQKKIDDLKQLGIRISIDDFGTGYSSLSRIRNLPIDKVKIDRAFIEDLESSKSDKQIIEAITFMAQGLGFKVVAEGVETLEQLNLLRIMNCDIVQGFLLSKPLVRDKFEQLLENQNLVIELD